MSLLCTPLKHADLNNIFENVHEYINIYLFVSSVHKWTAAGGHPPAKENSDQKYKKKWEPE